MSQDSLSFFDLGEKFLRLAKYSSEEIVNNNNSYSVLSERLLTAQEIDDATKWCDVNVSVPTLFNFYHGIELILKGAIVLISGNPQENINLVI
ncbi:hypothetical protein A4G20_06720 [Pasteurellaceae bacterium RH1A]|nr:hypothetical protein A4G20_06720 [Pasteurellaceae bacterium RH1A]